MLEELVRLEKDLAVASEERSLYEEEKVQLLTRRTDALEDLKRLEESEAATHETIRSSEELLHGARAEFESVTEVASKARVDVETAVGNVNAVQREHENLSRIVASLRGQTVQLQASEIEGLIRRKEETESAVEVSRGELAESLESLHLLAEQRVTVEAEVSDLE